jgi:transposase
MIPKGYLLRRINAAHKSKAAEKAIRGRGAWILFLPSYSPDLNPIEMAFAKLKAHLRAKAVRTIRTIDALWQEIGRICDLFEPKECQTTSPPPDMDSAEHPPPISVRPRGLFDENPIL